MHNCRHFLRSGAGGGVRLLPWFSTRTPVSCVLLIFLRRDKTPWASRGHPSASRARENHTASPSTAARVVHLWAPGSRQWNQPHQSLRVRQACWTLRQHRVVGWTDARELVRSEASVPWTGGGCSPTCRPFFRRQKFNPLDSRVHSFSRRPKSPSGPTLLPEAGLTQEAAGRLRVSNGV